MTTAVVADDAAVVYLVYNTIMNRRTQQGQLVCFANAARHRRQPTHVSVWRKP